MNSIAVFKYIHTMNENENQKWCFKLELNFLIILKLKILNKLYFIIIPFKEIYLNSHVFFKRVIYSQQKVHNVSIHENTFSEESKKELRKVKLSIGYESKQDGHNKTEGFSACSG